jgi:hypothetical protein
VGEFAREPAMTYRLDETGLQMRSQMTLSMHGAVFHAAFAETLKQ